MIKLFVGDVRIELEGSVSMTVEGDTISISTKEIKQQSPYVLPPQTSYQERPLSEMYKDTPTYMQKKESYLEPEDFLKLNQDPEIPTQNSDATLSPAYEAIAREGATSLRGLVETWSINLGGEGEQPNRSEALLECIEDNGTAVLAFIDRCGGLTKAILRCWEGNSETARTIAMNMAQVSSIIFPPLSQKLELFYKQT